jgi:SPP1 gp7 family putative phage head morphogenesis protein
MQTKVLPLPDSFWQTEMQILYRILFPLVSEAIVRSARFSYDDIAGQVDLGLSWDVVNDMAVTWAEQHTAAVVAQISKTSMAGFLNEFEDWQKSGEPLPDLVARLMPYYGPVRAEMVAVTETTRAYALGNMSVWRSTGMVDGFKVVIAQDEIVCPICFDKYENNPYGMDDETPPFHVNCRCAIQPVLV